MKSYLLDTHILLWWLTDNTKLSKKIKDLINDPHNDIIVSATTIWEIVIKKALGKLEAPDNLQEVLEENNIRSLSMTIEHALFVGQLPLLHQDPFDRLLIAQCLVEDLTFITQDAAIAQYRVKLYS